MILSRSTIALYSLGGAEIERIVSCETWASSSIDAQTAASALISIVSLALCWSRVFCDIAIGAVTSRSTSISYAYEPSPSSFILSWALSLELEHSGTSSIDARTAAKALMSMPCNTSAQSSTTLLMLLLSSSSSSFVAPSWAWSVELEQTLPFDNSAPSSTISVMLVLSPSSVALSWALLVESEQTLLRNNSAAASTDLHIVSCSSVMAICAVFSRSTVMISVVLV